MSDLGIRGIAQRFFSSAAAAITTKRDKLAARVSGVSLKRMACDLAASIGKIFRSFGRKAVYLEKNEKLQEPATEKLQEPATEKLQEPATEKLQEPATEKLQEQVTEIETVVQAKDLFPKNGFGTYLKQFNSACEREDLLIASAMLFFMIDHVGEGQHSELVDCIRRQSELSGQGTLVTEEFLQEQVPFLVKEFKKSISIMDTSTASRCLAGLEYCAKNLDPLSAVGALNKRRALRGEYEKSLENIANFRQFPIKVEIETRSRIFKNAIRRNDEETARRQLFWLCEMFRSVGPEQDGFAQELRTQILGLDKKFRERFSKSALPPNWETEEPIVRPEILWPTTPTHIPQELSSSSIPAEKSTVAREDLEREPEMSEQLEEKPTTEEKPVSTEEIVLNEPSHEEKVIESPSITSSERQGMIGEALAAKKSEAEHVDLEREPEQLKEPTTKAATPVHAAKAATRATPLEEKVDKSSSSARPEQIGAAIKQAIGERFMGPEEVLEAEESFGEEPSQIDQFVETAQGLARSAMEVKTELENLNKSTDSNFAKAKEIANRFATVFSGEPPVTAEDITKQKRSLGEFENELLKMKKDATESVDYIRQRIAGVEKDAPKGAERAEGKMASAKRSIDRANELLTECDNIRQDVTEVVEAVLKVVQEARTKIPQLPTPSQKLEKPRAAPYVKETELPRPPGTESLMGAIKGGTVLRKVTPEDVEKDKAKKKALEEEVAKQTLPGSLKDPLAARRRALGEDSEEPEEPWPEQDLKQE